MSAGAALSSRAAAYSAAALRLRRRYGRGALDELVELANTGRQQQRAAVAIRASEIFQYELGRIEAELRAARAFCQAQARAHWCHALAGTLNNEVLLAEGTQTAIWITATCVRA